MHLKAAGNWSDQHVHLVTSAGFLQNSFMLVLNNNNKNFQKCGLKRVGLNHIRSLYTIGFKLHKMGAGYINKIEVKAKSTLPASR